MLLLLLIGFGALTGRSEGIVFSDSFRGKLGEGWSWVREHREGWRMTEHGLEIRVEPGNMWGPPNNARNVLVRPLPASATNQVAVSVNLRNRPTEQYEQVDLVWYYDDSHMVKIGQELVDGKLSVVMGREEADRTRTIAIIPIDSLDVQVRFLISGNRIRGQYRASDTGTWQEAGTCDLPVKGAPKVSLQCYQGPRNEERWAILSDFRITRWME